MTDVCFSFESAARRMAVTALAFVILASTVTSVAEVDDEGRTYPSLPGATREPPGYVTENAPFGVLEFFVPPPPERNAAPLYLEAFFEFTDDIALAFPQEVRDKQLPVVRERVRQVQRFSALLGNSGFTDKPEEVGALLEAHELGIRKLREAQQREKCMFVTDLSVVALLGHAQAARQVVWLLDVKTRRDLSNARLDDAVDNVEVALRLGRDLRPRGYLVTQLVSIAIDTIVFSSLVPQILNADELAIEQIDRLLQIVKEHQAEGADSYREGLKMEYLMVRKLLHDLAHRTGHFGPGWRKQWDIQAATTIGELLVALDDSAELHGGNERLAQAVDEDIDALTPAELPKKIELLNRTFPALINLPELPYAQRDERIKQIWTTIGSDEPLVRLYWPPQPAFAEMTTARHKAWIGGTVALIAVRRWQLAEDQPLPVDLATIIKAADLEEDPIDPYAGKPIKLALVGGEPVIYSVGSDEQDQGASQDWQHGKQPGDFLFRLKSPER